VLKVLGSVWALLLGMLLLMIGNGMQSTLIGIRGGLEGFSTFELSVVMSGYFAGFLLGSRLAPMMIRRVGHVRVFAALASMVSAILILYPSITAPWAWLILRIAFGFCFSGVYVTAESWLNNAVDNENRGRALSLYLIVQMGGLAAAQGFLLMGDASGFVIFVIPSVLVSLSFLPILLAVNPTPAFETSKPLSLVALYRISPLGCVGVLILGGVYGALYGMPAVYGTAAGMTLTQIPIFVAMITIGALIFQYPIGWLSDRRDRRRVIMAVSVLGGLAALVGMALGSFFPGLLAVAFIVGGLSNPLYGLLIAYTNDFLESDDMAAASGGLIFLNGVGAIVGPIVTGWALGQVGPAGFWLVIAVLMLASGVYAAWRMMRRPILPSSDETVRFAPIPPSVTPVAVEVVQELYSGAQEPLGEKAGGGDTGATRQESAT
jgi:MFS family permease